MSRRNILLALLIAQTLLLYASTSALAGRGVLYGCDVFCDTPIQAAIIPAIAAAIGIAMFVLPSLIGAICQSWQGAVTLAVAPWWLTVTAHAGTLLRPYVGLGGTGGRFDPPSGSSSLNSPPVALADPVRPAGLARLAGAPGDRRACSWRAAAVALAILAACHQRATSRSARIAMPARSSAARTSAASAAAPGVSL